MIPVVAVILDLSFVFTVLVIFAIGVVGQCWRKR